MARHERTREWQREKWVGKKRVGRAPATEEKLLRNQGQRAEIATHPHDRTGDTPLTGNRNSVQPGGEAWVPRGMAEWQFIRERQRADSAFVTRTMGIIEGHLSDPLFSTAALSGELGYSRMHVNRRLRSITGCSTKVFIRHLRLRRARELLNETGGSVASIARLVGFRSPSHFSKAFRATWGVSPIRLRRADPAYFH